MNVSIFEAIMLICFGLAWPFSISKSIKSKSTKGKSLFFLLVIMLGYASGITHKFLYSRDFVMPLYILNFTMVTIDVCLYFRNRAIEKAADTLSTTKK